MNKSLIRIFYWDGMRKHKLFRKGNPFSDPLSNILSSIDTQTDEEELLIITLYIYNEQKNYKNISFKR